MQTIRVWKRALVGGLCVAACMAVAAPKAKTAQATKDAQTTEKVTLGAFKGVAKGGLDIVSDPETKGRYVLLLHGGVTLTSPNGNIAGDEVKVTMANKGRDLETAEAVGHVKIVTVQKERVITSTSESGVLDNGAREARLSGSVLVKVDDPQNPMVIKGAETAVIDLTSNKIKVRPGPGGQVHFESVTPPDEPAPAKKGK